MSTAGSGMALEKSGSGRVMLSRLSLMMFLQYFVQGAYLPIASVYVERSLGFSSIQVGWFISALAIGPILAPFFVGQLVDRWFATERVMAAFHIAGGILMIWLSLEKQVMPVIILGTVYSILYVPTMMLTNSLAFQHLRNSDMEFPWIRLFGTLGYIVPAYVIELWWLRGLEGPALDNCAGRGVHDFRNRRHCHGCLLLDVAPHTPGPEKEGLRARRGYFPAPSPGFSRVDRRQFPDRDGAPVCRRLV